MIIFSLLRKKPWVIVPLISIFSISYAEDTTFLLEPDIVPNVLTSTRLKQHQSNIPGSVTILDKDFIKASGAREIADVLRFVPGMSVGYRDGHNPSVSYHGTSYRDSRRMQVLVDQQPITLSSLANVNWADIPVAIEDIERIEIHRGPNSASYGSNSFMGVIHIITSHPSDVPSLSLQARKGDINTEDYLARYSTSNKQHHFKISLQQLQDDGFDINKKAEVRHDSKDSNSLYAQYIIQPNASWHLKSTLGYSKGYYTEDFFDASIVTQPNFSTENIQFASQLNMDFSEKHSMQIQLQYLGNRVEREWTSCLPPELLLENLFHLYRLDSDYAKALVDGKPYTNGTPRTNTLAINTLQDAALVAGKPSSCGETNENAKSSRVGLEVTNTYIFSDKLRLLTGISLQEDTLHSDTFFSGTQHQWRRGFFFHSEYKPSTSWSLNIGGMFQNEKNTDSDFSPRVGINWHITPNHTIRGVWSEAIRTPDLLETDMDWYYTLEKLQPAVLGKNTANYIPSKQSTAELKNETITSYEIGYYGLFPQWDFSLDIKLFHDSLDDLISESISLEAPEFSNSGWVEQEGIEIESNWKANQFLNFRLTYANIETRSNQHQELTFVPEESGSFFGIFNLNENWQMSLGYSHADNINKYKYRRADARIAYTINTGEKQLLTIALSGKHRLDDNGDIFIDNQYKDKTHLYLTIKYQLY